MRRSVRDFAALLGVETTTISNWRSGLGSVTPRSGTQAILDTTLAQRTSQADRERFEQIVSEGEQVWRARHKAGRQSVPDESVPPTYDESTWPRAHQADDMRRSDFLRGLIAVSTTTLSDNVIAAATGPLDQLPTHIGVDHVERVSAWASIFRSADDAGLPVGDGMVGQLRTAAEYLHANMPHPIRQGMHEAVGTLFRVVGWAHYDRGNHDAAKANFHAGLHCAEQSDAWWLRATVLTCLARQAIYLGNADNALTMLGLAGIRPDRLSLLRRADIAAVQARAFGQLGNAVECSRAVEHAEQLFIEAQDENHPDTEHEGFGTYYSEALLRGDTAQGLFDLAYHRNAEVDKTVDRLRFALTLPDEHLRSRHLSVMQLSALQLRHGDCDEGIALGRQALGAAAGTTSARVLDGLRLVHQAINHAHLRQVAGASELQRDIADLVHTS
ncbi:hypothetical protein GCM10023318_54990 [Nocardia callitridis]|uniref:Transcriptional regulator n=2 Tax=Nocardia callitridis TaxID=648753 RepID=A0ABP9KZ15_9NOCA